MGNRQVAGELFISIKTVQFHLTHIYAKLSINNRAKLAALLRDKVDHRSSETLRPSSWIDQSANRSRHAVRHRGSATQRCVAHRSSSG